jgi:hypothetical protein
MSFAFSGDPKIAKWILEEAQVNYDDERDTWPNLIAWVEGTGKRSPSWDEMRDFAEHAGIPIAYFLMAEKIKHEDRAITFKSNCGKHLEVTTQDSDDDSITVTVANNDGGYEEITFNRPGAIALAAALDYFGSNGELPDDWRGESTKITLFSLLSEAAGGAFAVTHKEKE